MAEAARQRRLFQALFMIRVLVMFFSSPYRNEWRERARTSNRKTVTQIY